MRRSVIVSAIVVATGLMLAGCADSPAGPSTGAGPEGGDAAAGAEQQPAPEAKGEPFSSFPLCAEFNQMSMDDELAVISLATGTDYDEDSGWDFASNVQTNCSLQGWGDKSVLRAIVGGLTAGQELQVAWSVNTAPGSWGGFSFPAEIDGYRLVGEEEYAEFVEMRPEICASMQDLGDALVAESGLDGHTARAYYTAFDGPVGPADACEWGSDSLTVLFAEKPTSEGWFSQAAPQPNGVSCSDAGILICAVKTDAGIWTAVDRIDAMDIDGLAGFLKTVVDAQ